MIGISRDQWMLVAAALTLGGSIRVGLEDNLYLPNGEMARSNGELIAKARQMTEDVGRRPASVAEARAMLNIAAPAGVARMSLPLEGMRVLDLSRLLPGGFCSLLLADFGADVLKVEDTGMGDYIRWSPPFYEGAHESARSALFLALNRNKRSIRLDLKSDGGREALLRAGAANTTSCSNRSARACSSASASATSGCARRNPGIVFCAISGYGQTGPKRDASGHDMNYLGLIGLLGLTGERGGEPVQAAGQIADLGGGALMAAFGIMAALRERDGSPGRIPARARGSWSTCRWPTARCRGLRWSRARTSPTARCRAAAICRWPARWSATGRMSAPTAGSRSARSSRSSGRRGVAASAARS